MPKDDKEHTLNHLPDAVRPWLQDVTSTDVVILNHVGFGEDLQGNEHAIQSHSL